MIQIDDNDLPITVAEKIIDGTKSVPADIFDKAAYRAFTGKELGETLSEDMFGIEEIKEIADYLMVYYRAHIREVRHRQKGE